MRAKIPQYLRNDSPSFAWWPPTPALNIAYMYGQDVVCAYVSVDRSLMAINPFVGLFQFP